MEPADLPVFFAHQRDPAGAALVGRPPRDEDAFAAHWARILADDEVRMRAVLHGDALAGNVGAWTADGLRLVGYWIGREHWGRGVATRALAAFLDEETARPLHAEVLASNVGSIKVLERGGFRRASPPPATDERLYILT